MSKQPFPVEESKISILAHVVAPAIIAFAVASYSLWLDVSAGLPNWFQRSGSIMAAVGVYIAFHESRWFFKAYNANDSGVSVFINPEIKYKWLALAYAILGTGIWGYGDLLILSVV